MNVTSSQNFTSVSNFFCLNLLRAVVRNQRSWLILLPLLNIHTLHTYIHSFIFTHSTQHNKVHIWARGPAKPRCRLFNIYADVYKYQVLCKRKNRSTKAGHENPKKPAGGKNTGNVYRRPRQWCNPWGFRVYASA